MEECFICHDKLYYKDDNGIWHNCPKCNPFYPSPYDTITVPYCPDVQYIPQYIPVPTCPEFPRTVTVGDPPPNSLPTFYGGGTFQ